MADEHEDPLLAVGRHLAALDELMRDPSVLARRGAGIQGELRGPVASFRQKFPDALPGAQPPLL